MPRIVPIEEKRDARMNFLTTHKIREEVIQKAKDIGDSVSEFLEKATVKYLSILAKPERK